MTANVNTMSGASEGPSNWRAVTSYRFALMCCRVAAIGLAAIMLFGSFYLPIENEVAIYGGAYSTAIRMIHGYSVACVWAVLVVVPYRVLHVRLYKVLFTAQIGVSACFIIMQIGEALSTDDAMSIGARAVWLSVITAVVVGNVIACGKTKGPGVVDGLRVIVGQTTPMSRETGSGLVSLVGCEKPARPN